ncbi:MAG: hypothetical protein RBR62_04815 [Bacteroidales bacterium]|jgi:hypothetical protein|nr:hypothetical protein [Bacteroidales bacterium]
MYEFEPGDEIIFVDNTKNKEIISEGIVRHNYGQGKYSVFVTISEKKNLIGATIMIDADQVRKRNPKRYE